jgi:hypothetical protein
MSRLEWTFFMIKPNRELFTCRKDTKAARRYPLCLCALVVEFFEPDIQADFSGTHAGRPELYKRTV